MTRCHTYCPGEGVPFSPRAVLEVVFMTLVPLLPLALTMLSPQEVLERLLKMLF